MLVAQGIGAEGSDREALRAWLAGVGTTTEAYDGVTGRIAFDANGDVDQKPVVIGVIRDGAVVTANAATTTAAAN